MTQSSVVVFRTTVLSLIFVLTAGPSVSLFCWDGCDPAAAVASGCHSDDSRSSTSVTSADSCQEAVQGRAIFLKDDLRRRASADGAGSVAAVHCHLAAAVTRVPLVDNHGRVPSGQKRPQTTPLRI